MKRMIFPIFALFVGLQPAHVTAQSALETLNYAIWHEDEQIGTHRVTMSQVKHQIRVDLHTEIKIEGFFSTSYAFDHTAQETWAGGVMYDMTSITEVNGERMSVRAYTQDERLIVDSLVGGRDRRQKLALGIQPSSLWNADTVNQSKLLNVQDGKVLATNLKDFGEETHDVQGVPTKVHHYGLSGELTRHLWYDENGRLVRMEFPDKDMQTVLYVLK